MNHVRWAAWGTVDIEQLDRQQRRNYLKKVHAEIKEHGFVLHVGGTTKKPYYLVTKIDDPSKKVAAYQSEQGAFSGACKGILLNIGEATDGPAAVDTTS